MNSTSILAGHKASFQILQSVEWLFELLLLAARLKQSILPHATAGNETRFETAQNQFGDEWRRRRMALCQNMVHWPFNYIVQAPQYAILSGIKNLQEIIGCGLSVAQFVYSENSQSVSETGKEQ